MVISLLGKTQVRQNKQKLKCEYRGNKYPEKFPVLERVGASTHNPREQNQGRKIGQRTSQGQQVTSIGLHHAHHEHHP